MRREPVPHEPRHSILDPELRPPEQRQELGAGARLLGRERREALAVVGEVGVLTGGLELALERSDPARAVDPRVREVVARRDDVERRPHERRLHDLPPLDRTHEVVWSEAVHPRPQPEVGRGRPLRLQPRGPLDRLRNGDSVPPEQ